jgi:U6 snRNA-associated Sm-like protein LSm1
MNTDSPDLFLKSLIMKSNQQSQNVNSQQQYEQQQLKSLQTPFEQHNEIQPQQQLINQLGSMSSPLLPQNPNSTLLQNQNIQAAQILNRNHLQQLLHQQQQQQLKNQQLQHQLIEERLLQQSQQQQHQNFLIQSQMKHSPPLQSASLYSNNTQLSFHHSQPQIQQKQPKPVTTTNDESEILTSSNYLPGTASLIEYIDKQLMIILRDGKKLIGYLRSIDQYANLLLSSTFERIYVNNKYADIQRGVYIVRGENVVLLGEVDFNMPPKVNLEQVSEKEILELQNLEKKKQEESDKSKKRALIERCLIPNTDTMLDEYY